MSLFFILPQRKTVDSAGPVVTILVTGSEVRGFKPGRGRWIFSERKNPEYEFLRKGKKVKPWAVVDLRHVKEFQAEIRASEQHLPDFSRSLEKATLMTLDVKSVVKPKSTLL